MSEGLAGHFVTQVMGGPPDPWDQVRPMTGSLRQAAALWARRDHDFGEWFLGRGRIRKWTGYGIGSRLVAEHLQDQPDESALTLAWARADSFRPALRRLLASEGIEEPEEADGEEGAGAGRDASEQMEPVPVGSGQVGPDPGSAVQAGDDGAEENASRDAGGPAPRTPRDI